MKAVLPLCAACLLAAVAVPAAGEALVDLSGVSSGTSGASGSASLPPYLQCVPYARRVSGIQIYGDAHTWWDQAEGRYARGLRPRVGAVMAFKPYGNSSLGHVAAVSRIVDKRTVLIRHANWSPINGRRGQIEDDVRAVDVSPENDWSEVRVWFAPIQDLGATHWPVQGFIYPVKPAIAEPKLAIRTPRKPGKEPENLLSAAMRGDKLTAAPSDDPIGAIIASRLARR